MPNITTLEGQTLSFGKEESYSIDDERAFILYLDKMFRAADPKNKAHISALAKNMNVISGMLNLGQIPEDGVLDDSVQGTFNYFAENKDLFLKHGISKHIDAKKLEKITNPAFTEAEHAPTIEEMKKLEVDIGQLYGNEATPQG